MAGDEAPTKSGPPRTQRLDVESAAQKQARPSSPSASSDEPTSSLFDLESHYAFYGAYHSDPVNKAIHIVFVWPILFTALLLLQYTPAVVPLPASLLAISATPLSSLLVFNAAAAVALVYAGFYVAMERRVGSLAAALVAACLVGSRAVFLALGPAQAWKWAVAVQAVSWTVQFIGHGVFERRAPALLDNLLQAFLMAPFFVLLEVLEGVAGFEPFPGFRVSVQEKVAQQQEKQRRKLK